VSDDPSAREEGFYWVELAQVQDTGKKWSQAAAMPTFGRRPGRFPFLDAGGCFLSR
jgi:hypothetical protein